MKKLYCKRYISEVNLYLSDPRAGGAAVLDHVCYEECRKFIGVQQGETVKALDVVESWAKPPGDGWLGVMVVRDEVENDVTSEVCLFIHHPKDHGPPQWPGVGRVNKVWKQTVNFRGASADYPFFEALVTLGGVVIWYSTAQAIIGDFEPYEYCSVWMRPASA